MKRLLTILLLCSCGLISAQNYHIGDLYTAPDGSQGIVFYLHPDGSGGWAVALTDCCIECAWGDTLDIPDLPNSGVDHASQLLHDTAGYAHTQAMRAAQAYVPHYAAWNVDFENGWYLPAPQQLSLLFGLKAILDPALISAGGTILGEHVSNKTYWSSSEQSASEAWTVDFGWFAYYPGDFELQQKYSIAYGVRGVRNFTYTTVVHDSTLTYEWTTGSTDPSIEVSPAQTTTYTVTATSEFGCSNTATQTILVATGGTQTIYDTICQGEGYDANGFTLTEAETDVPGTLSRERTVETNGCTATVTLQLWVKATKNTVIPAAACSHYTWNGVTNYESGTYTQTYAATNGCDSVATLVLNISEPPQVTVTATADTVCPGNSVELTATTGPSTPTITIGDILCTDGSFVKPSAWPVEGKTAMGIVFYVDDSGLHGWAVNLEEQSSSITWGQMGTDIPTLQDFTYAHEALADTNGYTNTQLIRTAGDASQYAAAYAVDFENGWYLPATGQLNLLFLETNLINPSLQAVGGVTFPPSGTYTWTSTEHSSYYAWTINFFNGSVIRSSKISSPKVRSVRSF
ncbi:MAG: hypothetical protein IKN78_11055 [Bacteroidales bacterium]|nr:hypothetical protein [Bacteroidales bacterium]